TASMPRAANRRSAVATTSSAVELVDLAGRATAGRYGDRGASVNHVLETGASVRVGGGDTREGRRDDVERTRRIGCRAWDAASLASVHRRVRRGRDGIDGRRHGADPVRGHRAD